MEGLNRMRYVRRVFQSMFKNKKGAENRVRLMKLLLNEPLNRCQMGKRLGLNYRTVKHHVDVLVKEEMLSITERHGRYGALYYPSETFKRHLLLFYDIIGTDHGGE